MWERFKKYIIGFGAMIGSIFSLIIFYRFRSYKEDPKPEGGIKDASKNANKVIDEYIDYTDDRMRILGDKK